MASKGIKGKAKWLVYLNHFIIGWDDNIWWFALGLFLIEITPQNLQFTASYGLVGGIVVLLFGTVVGDWVDRTSRLTVARTTVLVQNSALIVCCIIVYVVIEYKTDIAEVLPNEGLLRMCYALIIIIAILSNLTNMARKTAIERDWIVEICDKDPDMLASLSATMRRISLLTMVIAPIVTGQLLSRTSHSTGALVVAGWNFITIFVEYALLWKIYQEVPQLSREKIREERHMMFIEHMQGVDVIMEFNDLEEKDTKVPNQNADKDVIKESKLEDDKPKYTFWTSLCASYFTLRRGWKIFKNYEVAFAGLALASLYLTVLGFHSITIGYAYSQGLSEDLIGGLVAAAACSGIIGTFLYPKIRHQIGLQRTGLYALAAEVSSLTLCVISIFCPGSPFDPLYFSRNSNAEIDSENLIEYTTSFSNNITTFNVTTEPMTDSASAVTSYVSISLLLTGIIGARIGLWLADLTITQLFLESVDVTERGIVAGVQNALNELMDMLKYAIVILLPVPEVFGYLVIISYCFICLGWILFAVYVKKVRGYVFPCFKPKANYDLKSDI
ncbi:solute carrier family 40 member 1-like isoform X2 [Ruditapes philippinarum]|uniref:solute carrier family 40 member 1-like isoform X2 n=1 Tax=Ruditapes philippinarum TaxID=129788 RepID=UPI00295B8478|nr:solute carrier family 40 member 1-like isoform X2 [Ruditapes philippinarum]